MHQQSSRLWTGPFVLTMAVNLVFATVFFMTVTTMALYASDRFGASDAMAGFASSAFVLGAVFARLFAGRFIDLLGRRRSMLIALACYVVGGLAYFAADSLGLLLAIRLVHGMAFGAGASAVTTIAMALIPVQRRAEGTGYFGVSGTFAAALGPFVAITALEHLGHTGLFTAGVAFAAVGLAMGLLLRTPELERGGEGRWWRLRVSHLLEPSAMRIGLVILVVGAAYAGVLTYLTSFTEQAGMTWAPTWFFIVYGTAVMLARIVLGRVQDVHGADVVVYPALAAFALGMVTLALGSTDVIVVLAAVLIGFGFGALVPSLQAVAVTVSPPTRLAVAVSSFYLMLDLGVGLAPLALGLLLPLTGYAGMYLLLAAVVLCGAAIYYVVHGRGERMTLAA